MNDFATDNQALYPCHSGFWPANTLRVVDLDDLEDRNQRKETDVHKLFPSESFSLSNSSNDDGDSVSHESLLTPFKYTPNSRTKNPDTEWTVTPSIPSSIFAPTYQVAQVTPETTDAPPPRVAAHRPIERMHEGTGIIPLPDDLSSTGSLDSMETEEYASPCSCCDGLWNTDPPVFPKDDDVDPFEQYAAISPSLTEPPKDECDSLSIRHFNILA